MPHRNEQPEKAYKNLEFLTSPDARILRILSEFLEPFRRFRSEGVRDTIVFFGSARTIPRPEAQKHYETVQHRLEKTRRPTPELLQEFEEAKADLQMSRYYEDAVTLANLLAKWSKTLDQGRRFVICSGGGPGIMEAANRGAHLADVKSVGMNISLPFEQRANPFIDKRLNFEFHYFFMRKFWFAYLAKAIVFFPGGYGTMDEMMEVLTLLQTGKIKKKMTAVVYGTEYWNQVLNFQELVKRRTISASDLRLFKFMDDPQETFEYLKAELTKNYLRVGGKRESLLE
ncbi:MAG TPA: TIGR00730 family Rossman fold protein [Bacteroidota bacterium]